MTFYKNQIYYTASIKRNVFIGLILCIYLNFIIIALQPFGTDQFEAENKLLLLSGFGVITCLVYIFYSRIEYIWYLRKRRIWRVSNEIFATAVFCFFSGTVLYLYNTGIVNQEKFTIAGYWRYLFITVACMIPVFVPIMVYLRQKFGEKTELLADNCVMLTGENKHEILRLEKEEVLFIKAIENYVEICFIEENKKVSTKTFRQTLSNVSEQLPFLEKCHRSYLVNINNVKAIIGNSQSAKISFAIGEKEIPLSKTYYKHIKNSLN